MAQLLALLLALTSHISTVVAATVYRCHISGEAITFADRPCKGGVAVEITPGSTIAMAPLTAEEAQRLENIARTSQKRASQRAGERRRSRANQVTQRHQAASACEVARTELRALKIRRRQGYTLAEAAKIGKRADALKDLIRSNC